MSELQDFSELRNALVRRGRDPFLVLLPEDFGTVDSDARYLVFPQEDGKISVRMYERGDLYFSQTFADEPSAVRFLDARIQKIVYGPAPTADQIKWSKAASESVRQRMLAELRSTRLETPPGEACPRLDPA